LREKLEKKSVAELYRILKKLDPRRAKTIEKKNPRRLIRAIEIIKKTGALVPILVKKPLPYPVGFLGVRRDKKELKKLIHKRLISRLKHGMLAEVKNLRKSGISWKRLEEFGLEYRYLALYSQKKIDYQEMVVQLERAINQYARRQMVWFKRDARIKWVKDYPKTQRIVENFLGK
jgi:tRNA dimethylallyltransferase